MVLAYTKLCYQSFFSKTLLSRVSFQCFHHWYQAISFCRSPDPWNVRQEYYKVKNNGVKLGKREQKGIEGIWGGIYTLPKLRNILQPSVSHVPKKICKLNLFCFAYQQKTNKKDLKNCKKLWGKWVCQYFHAT